MEPLIADVRRLRPTRVLILGGSDTVGAYAAAALTARTAVPVPRLAGQDRYVTAARAALSTFRAPVHQVLIARSDDATDAAWLSGHGRPVPAGRCLPPGPRCGTHPSPTIENGIPVLLVTGDGVPLATTHALQHMGPRRVTVVGAVSHAVMQELQEHTSGEVTRTPTAGTGATVTTPRP